MPQAGSFTFAVRRRMACPSRGRCRLETSLDLPTMVRSRPVSKGLKKATLARPLLRKPGEDLLHLLDFLLLTLDDLVAEFPELRVGNVRPVAHQDRP